MSFKICLILNKLVLQQSHFFKSLLAVFKNCWCISPRQKNVWLQYETAQPLRGISSENAEAPISSKPAADLGHSKDAGQKQNMCQHIFINIATFSRSRKGWKKSVHQCSNQTFIRPHVLGGQVLHSLIWLDGDLAF